MTWSTLNFFVLTKSIIGSIVVQAKKIREASDKNGLYWSYYNTKGKEKLEIYDDKTLWTKL